MNGVRHEIRTDNTELEPLKVNAVPNSNGESKGKKFIFPPLKSKLDKYKKKIIKKDPK